MPEQSATNIFPTLRRRPPHIARTYARALETARANRHQWDRLGTTFHPAEPDIVSVIQCVRVTERISEAELLAEARGRTATEILQEILRGL